MTRLLVVALSIFWLSPDCGADETRPLEFNGVVVGSTLEELKLAYPRAHCRSYRYQVSSDTDCMVDLGAALGTLVKSGVFRLIANRVSEIHLTLMSNPDAVLPHAKKSFGEATEADGLTWKFDNHTLSISPCLVDHCSYVRLSDSKNTERYAERQRAIQEQRPVVANLTPTAEHLEEGRKLVRHLRSSMTMKSMMPADIQIVLGAALAFVREFQVQNERVNATTRVFNVVGALPRGIKSVGEYRLSWGYLSNANGGSLALAIDDYSTCITERTLLEELGKNQKIDRSSIVQYMFDTLPPKGARGQVEYWTYTNASHVFLRFSFPFVCASHVNVGEGGYPAHWIPPPAFLGLSQTP